MRLWELKPGPRPPVHPRSTGVHTHRRTRRIAGVSAGPRPHAGGQPGTGCPLGPLPREHERHRASAGLNLKLSRRGRNAKRGGRPRSRPRPLGPGRPHRRNGDKWPLSRAPGRPARPLPSTRNACWGQAVTPRLGHRRPLGTPKFLLSSNFVRKKTFSSLSTLKLNILLV